MKKTCLLLFAGLSLWSCKKETVDQPAVDEEIIQSYITAENLDAVPTGNGLHVVIDEQGTGTQPNINSTVRVAYRGYFTDGTIFDQSTSNGISFSLNQVIQGWQEGIPYFKEGGKGILLVPSALGYGSQDYGGIPGNSVLVFDVHLIDVL